MVNVPFSVFGELSYAFNREVCIVDEKQRQAAIDVMIPAVRDMVKAVVDVDIEDEEFDQMIRETLLGLGENASAAEVSEALKKRFEEAFPDAKIKDFEQTSPESEESQPPVVPVQEESEQESSDPEKPQPPVVSLRKVGENKKKNTVRVAVVLDGDPIDHNLFIGIQASGGSDSLVARRINDGSNESHPISVPTGKDIQLEILPYNQCNFPADLRKQIKAPKKLPIYKIGEKHLHIA